MDKDKQRELERTHPRYSEIPNPCMHCKNLISVGSQFGADGWTCKAFPDGILYGILAGHTPHTEPWGYQSGDMVAFDPVIYTEDETGREWHYTADAGWQYVDEPTP